MSSSGHNRGATAPRSVLWRNNNKAIEDGEETPIYAHSFPVAGSTPIFMRRIETIRDLSSILGAEANTRLRALLQSSELFSVLNEFEFLGRSNTLTFLSSYATFDSANKKGALENAILKSGVASFASELNAERLEQGRFYTEARKMTALQRFAAKAQLIASLPSALGYEQRDTDSTTALLGELVALAPKLEASGNVHLRGGAPGDSGKRGSKGAAAGTDKAGADETTAAQSKRGKEGAGMGGASPEGKKARPARGVRGGRRGKGSQAPQHGAIEKEDEEDEEDEGMEEPPGPKKNLKDLMSAAKSSSHAGTLAGLLQKKSKGSAQSDSSDSLGSSLTPLAAAQQISDPTRLHELEQEVKTLTSELTSVQTSLAQIKAEKGALEAENARLLTSLATSESQLASVSAELAAKAQALAVSVKSVEAAQETTHELRQDRAMWSSLFMSTTQSFDSDKFQSLMGTMMRAPSKKADGSGPS